MSGSTAFQNNFIFIQAGYILVWEPSAKDLSRAA